jgi:ribonuclease R
MVHRLMTQYLERNFRADVNQLEKDCEYASERERVAAEAERSSIRYKQVEFLSARIGEVFHGVISGVIEHGLFVELQDSMCEGFVPVRSMQDDYYVFDDEFFCLRGRGARNVYRLGDLISVRIVATDLYKRTVEFAVVKGAAAEA